MTSPTEKATSRMKRSPNKKTGAITGRDPISQLYRAVLRYVQSSGGSIAVIGGVQIQKWPDEGRYNFTIAVKCTGIKPSFATTDGVSDKTKREAARDMKADMYGENGNG
jgi:hypothetical protein